MAYAALIFLDQQLEQLLPKHDHLYEKDQMESLHSNVIFLQKFMEDFPGNSILIKRLESKITDAAYEVSDVIAWGIPDDEKIKSCIRAICSIVEDAKVITKELEIKATIVGRDSWTTSSSSTTTKPNGKDTMVELDADLIRMKKRVFGYNSALQIIPVTGMGGIGKTTLAKSVYEDPRTAAHFNICSWVTVSQEYNRHNILKEILGDAELKVGCLISGVYQKLFGRRYLIVMDDIWDVEAWESIRNAFPDNNMGSRVVITTRSTEVATKVSASSPLHEMKLLNEIQSWELFQKEAFGQEYYPSPLDKIGKTISKRCKGLPLAIAVIARLLKLNRTEDYWEKFVRNMHEAMAEVSHDDQLMKILSMSYDNLPPHLKACFLYTSMFPEDTNIRTKKLKRLWVAEGFLKPTTDKSVEEVAEKCLLDLVNRILLSVGKRGSNGRIKTCTIHDLLRDLSLRKAKEDKFSQQIMTPYTVYRRCSYSPISKALHGWIYSLICHGKTNDEDILPTIRSKLVRVVDALETPFGCSISFGVNLRYLAFLYSGEYDDLNDTLVKVRKLHNLETLIIKHYHAPLSKTIVFPIVEMPKLKHFSMKARWGSNIVQLIDNNNVSFECQLQSIVLVKNFKFTTNAIKLLPNLVSVDIQYDEDTIFCAHLNNIGHLHHLEKMSLNMESVSDYMRLPSNITFPDKLNRLTFGKFTIPWEIMSVIGSLPNLQKLKLVNCWIEGDGEWEPINGEFQQLKSLEFGILNLREWKVESTHFPCLEQLVIDSCSNLNGVPDEVGEIYSLQKLVVRFCEKCVGDSAKKIQKEQQQMYENYQLQVLVENQWDDQSSDLDISDEQDQGVDDGVKEPGVTKNLHGSSSQHEWDENHPLMKQLIGIQSQLNYMPAQLDEKINDKLSSLLAKLLEDKRMQVLSKAGECLDKISALTALHPEQMQASVDKLSGQIKGSRYLIQDGVQSMFINNRNEIIRLAESVTNLTRAIACNTEMVGDMMERVEALLTTLQDEQGKATKQPARSKVKEGERLSKRQANVAEASKLKNIQVPNHVLSFQISQMFPRIPENVEILELHLVNENNAVEQFMARRERGEYCLGTNQKDAFQVFKTEVHNVKREREELLQASR